MPKVTVLMPVYNGEKYLRQAIDSILSQTFSDFNFLIIDDGSSDKSREIIQSYQDTFPKVKLLSNPQNIGLMASLNKGIKEIGSTYIARMDADDVAFPCRLEKQIQFLEEHPNISVLGTNMIVVDENLNFLEKQCLPSKSLQIKWNLYFGCCIAHPTVMMRRSILFDIGVYNENFKNTEAEDYELWLRATKKYEFYNLVQPLLYYRIHTSNMSISLKNNRDKSSIELLKYYISQLIDEIPEYSSVAAVCFKTDNYNSIQSYYLMQKMYQKFVVKNQLTSWREIRSLRIDMYNKLLGIIRRDKNYKRKFDVLIKIIQIDPFMTIFLLLTRFNKMFTFLYFTILKLCKKFL